MDDYMEMLLNMETGVIGILLGVLLCVLLLVLAFGIVTYVFQGIGLYRIAKRRGIRKPWLAWLPLGNMWILGSISDQYRYVAKGQVCNRRKILLGLTLAMMILNVLVETFAVSVQLSGFFGDGSGRIAFGGGSILMGLALSVVAIVAAVFQYIALHDLYASSKPDMAVLFLVLSIVFPVTLPFFVFACSKSDGGMPPRKSRQIQDVPPVAAEPVIDEPQEPVVQMPAEPEENTPEE